MTIRRAQLTLVGLALASVMIVCLVFVTGRLWYFPLDYGEQQDIALAQMTAPTFFAVLGSAASYLQAPGRVTLLSRNKGLLAALVWAPSLLFLFLFAVATTVFHIANQPGSDIAFSLASYRMWLTILLAAIGLTVPTLSAALFRTRVP